MASGAVQCAGCAIGAASGVGVDVLGEVEAITLTHNEVRETRQPMNRVGIRIAVAQYKNALLGTTGLERQCNGRCGARVEACPGAFPECVWNDAPAARIEQLATITSPIVQGGVIRAFAPNRDKRCTAAEPRVGIALGCKQHIDARAASHQ